MHYEAIVMGVSAGGLGALKTILPALPAHFLVPVIIVQHRNERADDFLADYLNQLSKLTVREAEDKEPIRHGHVYLAPGGYHLLVEKDKSFSLSADARVNYSCPSVDVLFESAADAFGEAVIGVVLTFSRVGREEVLIETVDSGQVVREILAEYEAIVAASKATILYDDLPVLKTSPTLLRILLQNLIGNALKFQNSTDAPQIRIEAQKQNDAWQFSVRDNGIGIDPNFYDRVFTIFQRIHRREEYPGTGSGLSTCQKFIRLCGGDIRFESTVGEGTTFYFTLPTEGI